FSLDTGKISDVVETQFGYHIIKVLDKQDARQLGYEEVEADMTKFLIGQKRAVVLEEFVSGLKKNAKIEMY
ncbi:MAG: peptidylprolyl isomerase, partial [Candidatus Omnitrophica bacterium]|nr:peptidylprolyl isomerase [Candidatus Omnitrophota bacterium]